MGLYIPDLRLPDDGDFELWIAVRKDGSFTYNVRGGWKDGKQKAVTVPPHGKLGDLDALTKEVNRFCDQYDAGIISTSTWANGILHALFNAPTIIEAEEG